jgi:hypothetical protein
MKSNLHINTANALGSLQVKLEEVMFRKPHKRLPLKNWMHNGRDLGALV